MFLLGLRNKYRLVARIFYILRKMHVNTVYHKLLHIIYVMLMNAGYGVVNFGSGAPHGENFKEYFITHNMPQAIKELKKGLDDISKSVVDEKIDRLLNLPLSGSKYTKSGMFFDYYFPYLIMSPLQVAEYKAYKNNAVYMKTKYSGMFSDARTGMFIKDDIRPPESFYYHHGLKLLDNHIWGGYIKDKVFLDCGAFLGDSSVVFNQYSPSKVYAFEVNLALKKHYYKNLRLNGINANKFLFVNKAVSNRSEKIKISKEDYTKMTVQSVDGIKENDRFIELVKIDDFCEDMEQIGLIKMDIEGGEYNAVLGAEKTIKRDKPVLLITIYHNPKQFFELKPLIESWNLGYSFMIRALSPSVTFLETTLISIPKM